MLYGIRIAVSKVSVFLTVDIQISHFFALRSFILKIIVSV